MGGLTPKQYQGKYQEKSQRAVIAARLANIANGGDRRSGSFQSADLPTETQPKISQPQAAEMLNVSERLVRTVKAALGTLGARTPSK